VVVDGGQAVEYLAGAGPFADRARHPLPALILLDINMPKKSGFEVLEWIRPAISVQVFASADIHLLLAPGRHGDGAEAWR